MDFNTIIMIVGIAVFILPVTFMLGWAWREKQQTGWAADARKAFDIERAALCKMQLNDLAAVSKATDKDKQTINEFEILEGQLRQSLDLAHAETVKMTRQWEYADKYRKAIVEALVTHSLWKFTKHEDNPSMMLTVLCDYVAKCAVDPLQNQKAKNLHTRGVRKGAKMGREQMRKQMQKCIDNQAATIRQYDVELTNANVRRMRFTEAVTNVMNDKLALPSVRRAFNQALIQEHDRLRAVDAQKAAQ